MLGPPRRAVARHVVGLTRRRRAGTQAPAPLKVRDLGITEGDRRLMSIATVRERLHKLATERGVAQYVEPTNGQRIWTVSALISGASSCGCRGGSASSAAADGAPCPFCATSSPDDGDGPLRYAADARAEVVATEVLAAGGSRLEAMRARLGALPPPRTAGGSAGGGGGGCGGGGGGGCSSAGGNDGGDDEPPPPPAVWRP